MFPVRAMAAAALLALGAAPADAGPPAARVGDPGSPGFHAGSAISLGSGDVFVNGVPAARLGSPTSCPQVCPVPVPAPHSPGTVTVGSTSVFVNGAGAARQGDTIVEPGTPSACQPVHAIATGSPNVFIGP